MPTKAEIAEFIEVFGKLSNFEAQTRLIRGYGAFSPQEIEDLQPRMTKIIEWLRAYE